MLGRSKILIPAILLACASLVSSGASAQSATVARQQAAAKAFSKSSPLRFIENKGQWDSKAQFLARTPGLDYWVTRNGFVLDAHDNASIDGERGRKGHAVYVNFVGATASSGEGIGQQHLRTDYYVGDQSRWAKGALSFNEAVLRSIYTGVDFRSYFDQGRPRYDLIVSAGADPSRIQLEAVGANRVEINSHGELVIQTSVGPLRQGGLYAYQKIGETKQAVRARFTSLGGNRIGFQIGDYDKSLPLIIDPLVYGTYFGGDGGYDEVKGVTTASDSSVYLTGMTQSPQFPVTPGAYSVTISGSSDAYIAKMQGDAWSVDYVSYIGGSGTETGQFLGLSPDGQKLWMAGTTTSANFPLVGGGSFQQTRSGSSDIFLMSFAIDPLTFLTPSYATYYGGTGVEILTGMDVGKLSGRIFLGGTSPNNTLPGPPSSEYGGGTADAFITAFDSTGTSISWAHYVGGSGKDTSQGIALDNLENAHICGTVEFVGNQNTSIAVSPRFVTTNGVYPYGRLLRNNDAFIRKYDPNGNLIFSSVLGGSGNDEAGSLLGPSLGSCIAVDNAGSIYLTGISRSFNFARTRGTFGQIFTASGIVFLTKISSDGTQILYSTSMRTTGNVWVNSLGVDNRGVATMVGTASWTPNFPGTPTTPGSIPTTGDAIDPLYEGGDRVMPPPMGQAPSTNDGFVLVLSEDATTLLYGSYIGLFADDTATCVKVEPNGNAFIGGLTVDSVPQMGADGLTAGYLTSDAFKSSVDPNGDGWMLKLRVGLPIIQSVTLSPPAIAGGLGASTVATVNLRNVAPPGGVSVTLSLDNPNAASFDANSSITETIINIPAGQSSGSATIFSRPVSSITSVQVKAGLEGDFKIANLVVAPWLDNLSINPPTVVGGNSVQLRIQLFQPAPANGVTVTLSSNNTQAVALPNPPTVVIPAGVQSQIVQLSTKGVDAAVNVQIGATVLLGSKFANVTITPASPQSLVFNPTHANGSMPVTVTLTLNGEAGPATSITINYVSGAQGLRKSDGSALPFNVTVPQGQRSVNFVVIPPAVANNTAVTLSATRNGTTVNGTLFIDFTDIQDLVLSAYDVPGGTVITGYVQLYTPAAPTGFRVPISNDNPAAGTLNKTSVLVPPGATQSEQFRFTTNVVASDVVAHLTAAVNGFTMRTKTVNVRAINYQFSITLNPNRLTGGATSIGTITANAPAPPGGLSIDLTSSDASVTITPSTVVIPAGATSANFTLNTQSVSSDRDVVITAKRGSTVVAQATLTVLAPQLISLVLDPQTVQGGQTSHATLTIDQPAPPGGMVITLSASQANLVQQPPTVFIPQGATSVSWDIVTSQVSRNIAVQIIASIPGRTTSVNAYLFINR